MTVAQDDIVLIAKGAAPVSRVIRSVFFLLLALALLKGLTPASAQSYEAEAAVRLQAGIEKENVDGDLPSAMKIYQGISADASAPRDVQATALLRLAGCEERLGRKAAQIYEQIVRDYADQPAASQARKRLAAMKRLDNSAKPITMSERKLDWSKVGYMGPVDTDGFRAVFRDADGNLFYGELSGRYSRMIFRAQPDDRPRWIPSRDFSTVALGFPAKPNRPYTLGVVRTDGTNYRELGRDDYQQPLNGNHIEDGNSQEQKVSWDATWSWDDRFLIAYSRIQTGGGLLLAISVADGHRRQLVSLDHGWIANAVSSPDGRFVAFEVVPQGEDTNESSKIFVLPFDGGEARQVYESEPNDAGTRRSFSNGTLRDWTADGRFLVIIDQHAGKPALSLLPVKNGEAAGTPIFIKYGEFEGAYTTKSGALIFEDHSTHRVDAEVFLTSPDEVGHFEKWTRVEIRHGKTAFTNPWPSFSPDGRFIAYVASSADSNKTDLVLHKLSTGKETVLYQLASKHSRCHFSFRTSKIYCTSDNSNDAGKTSLTSVDMESGASQFIELSDGRRLILQPSLDDQSVYFTTDLYGIGGPVFEWNQNEQRERLLGTPSRPSEWYFPSPDGHAMIRVSDGSFWIQPSPRSDWRLLVSGVHRPSAIATTADGKWVFYGDSDQAGNESLFRVRADGGATQRMGELPTTSFHGSIHLSADGTKILAVNDAPRTYDLWELENFEPVEKK